MPHDSKPYSFWEKLVSLMNSVGTLLVMLIMVTILLDIFGRALMGKPLPGTPEIVAMSIAAVVFLQFPSTLRAGRVIAADGLLDIVGRRSVRWEQWLQSIYHAIGGVMFSVVAWHVILLSKGAFLNSDYYGSLAVATFPKWPVFSVIAFGAAVMAVQYFILTFQFVASGRRKERLIEISPENKALS